MYLAACDCQVICKGYLPLRFAVGGFSRPGALLRDCLEADDVSGPDNITVFMMLQSLLDDFAQSNVETGSQPGGGSWPFPLQHARDPRSDVKHAGGKCLLCQLPLQEAAGPFLVNL